MMIGWVIWVMKFSQNVKKAAPKSSKNEKIIFILRLTSDDWPSDPSNKSRLKCKKRPPKSSKNEMLSFGLCSTSDDQPSDWSDKIWLKCEKGPLSYHKMKSSFLDYVQLLMIGWAIQAMKVNQNVAKGPLSHWTMKCSFLDYIQPLMIGQAIRVDQNAKKWNVVSVRVFCCFS